MATQARPADRHADATTPSKARPAKARPAGAFRPVALPALAAAMQAVRGGRPAAPRTAR